MIDILDEPANSLTHLFGTLFSIVAFLVLFTFALFNGTLFDVLTFSVFGISLIFAYLVSTLYHSVSASRVKLKMFLRKLDQAMIYIFIAGTYTPFAIILLRSAFGLTLLGAVWVLAVIGVAVKLTARKLPWWFTMTSYILMGGMAVFALPLVADYITFYGVVWILAGGVFYAAGGALFGIEMFFPQVRLVAVHETFHVLVMLGSFAHFWVILNYIL